MTHTAARLDLADDMTPERAEETIRALPEALGPYHLAKLDAIAVLDQQHLHERRGSKSMAAWVAAHCGCSFSAAKVWLQAARRIAGLPRLRQAICSGRLSIDKALHVARYATKDDEKREISWARRATYAAVKARADRIYARRKDDAKGYAGRRLRWWFGPEAKTVCLEACLPALEGRLVVDTLREVADRLPDPLEVHGEEALCSRQLSIETRMADALVETVLARGKSAPSFENAGAALAGAARKVELTIEVSYKDLLSSTGGCEVDGVGTFSSELARRFLCEGPFRVAFTGQRGELVALSTSARLPTRAMRRALKRRHKTCCFPGCPAKKGLIPHHVIYAGARGETDMKNLVLVCAYHHRLIHHGNWGVELDEAGNARWWTPLGELFDPPDVFIPYDHRIDEANLPTLSHADPAPYELEAERKSEIAARRALGLRGLPPPNGWDEVEDPTARRKEQELQEFLALLAEEEALDRSGNGPGPPGG